MNLNFLGDALDYWKGAIFTDLRSEKLVSNFRVDAMATDTRQPTDQTLFARLLRIQESQLISHAYNLRQARRQYFSEISSKGDLFLDPDTGINTGPVKRIEQYLQPSELFEILQANKDRLAIVYQHVRAEKTRQRLDKILATLERERKGHFFALPMNQEQLPYCFSVTIVIVYNLCAAIFVVCLVHTHHSGLASGITELKST
jgi:hypothetical protein